MDEDTLIELKVVQKDSEDNAYTSTLPQTFTLGQLRDWLQDELDFGGET